jgi:hypothetical protein
MLENLDSAPDKADPFLWADFAELRALIHADKIFSRGDLAAIANRSRDTGRPAQIPEDGPRQEDAAEIKGKPRFDYEAKWKDLIAFIATRSARLGDSYPFTVDDSGDTLQLANRGDWSHRTYLTLLLAASLRHISKARHHELTRGFEETCFAVFSKLMPPGSEIRATWAGGGAEAPYVGTLYEKMMLIAADLRCSANFDEDDFKSTDTGDGGIDLLAWHPMGDTAKGMPISFAQCGCSREDWKFKQLEASPAKHFSHLPVMHPWATYYFMPLDLRKGHGGWAYASDIGQAIIVDRSRLLKLMRQYDLGDRAPNVPLLEEALALREI